MIGEVDKLPAYAELTKDWPTEDKVWLETQIAENFRPVAAKHGRMCFSLVMQIGSATGACTLIAHHSQHMGNRVGAELRQAAQHLANILNDFAGFVAISKGLTNEMLRTCKEDIERMGALSMQVPNQKGSIIVAH